MCGMEKEKEDEKKELSASVDVQILLVYNRRLLTPLTLTLCTLNTHLICMLKLKMYSSIMLHAAS